MCGIAGIYRFASGRPVDGAVLDRMTDVLAHRGPDGRGTHVNGDLGLGHRRLAIIDLSDAGAQPMANEDGSLRLVFNGEIYNFSELRERLESRGHRFSTRSDTEVIVHLYEDYGDDCLRHLRGMFGLAIWDKRQQRLLPIPERPDPLQVWEEAWLRAEVRAALVKAVARLPDRMRVFMTARIVMSPLRDSAFPPTASSFRVHDHCKWCPGVCC